jgi:hypothetical protein
MPLGWHYLSLRQYDQSIQLLQEAIELDTTFPVPQCPLRIASRSLLEIRMLFSAVRSGPPNRFTETGSAS